MQQSRCDIFDMFESPTDARGLMFKPFELIDLSVIDDEVLLQKKWSAFFQMIMKHAHDRDVIKTIRRISEAGIISFLLEQRGGDSYIRTVLYYVCNVTNMAGDIRKFLQAIKNSANDIEDKIMTTVAEYLRQEGRQEGIERGIRLGEQEKQNEIVKSLLRNGIDINIIVEASGMSVDDVLKIKNKLVH